jgi:hypothetical protein
MTTRMPKAVFAAALATLAATTVADAQPYPLEEAAYGSRHHAAPEAYDAEANPHYGFGPRVRAERDDAVSGHRVIGRDPDPFIRGEVLRHYHSGWPD